MAIPDQMLPQQNVQPEAPEALGASTLQPELSSDVVMQNALIESVERDLSKLPADVRAQVEGDITAARQSLRSGNPASAGVINRIAQAGNNQDVKEMLQVGVGGALALAGVAGGEGISPAERLVANVFFGSEDNRNSGRGGQDT